MKKSKLLSSKGQGVTVSNNMQLAFVFFLFVAQAMAIFAYLWQVLGSDHVVDEVWVNSLLYLLFPALLVAVGFVYTTGYKTMLNKLFVATVKGLCAYALFSFLVAVNSHVAFLLSISDYDVSMAWFGSLWSTVILMATAFSAYVGVLHFWMYDKKGR